MEGESEPAGPALSGAADWSDPARALDYLARADGLPQRSEGLDTETQLGWLREAAHTGAESRISTRRSYPWTNEGPGESEAFGGMC